MTPNRKCQIEQLAMQILSRYHIRENPGNHLREITDGEGITLIDYHDWSVTECGRILIVDGEPVIFYNAMHTKEMQAFTIAHELGHYYLKHLVNEEVEIICINRDFERMDDSDDQKLEREVEANHFAACLLLPLNQLAPVFDTFMQRSNRRHVLYVDTQQDNFLAYKRCIYTIQMYFLVSETAIRFRLINLGWMKFNIKFTKTEDRGISIAAYLRKQEKTNKSFY